MKDNVGPRHGLLLLLFDWFQINHLLRAQVCGGAQMRALVCRGAQMRALVCVGAQMASFLLGWNIQIGTSGWMAGFLLGRNNQFGIFG